MTAFAGLFRRDLRLALRQGSETALVLGFFVLAVVLFPLGVGPEPELLRRIGPGVLWVAALLAALLSLDRLFQTDYEDGGLDLIALSPAPLEIAVLAKCAAHWITTGLPLTAASPFLALLVAVEPHGISVLALSLLLGTPSLSLIGAIAGALTLGARRAGVLSSLIALPLYVPPLVFGAGSVEASVAGTGGRAYLLILGALSLAALPLAPLAVAAALRQALE
ncbi:MAG: heme exporter protein CcmB [Alphaproteobacteria bacterium]|nr:heme exporter protein CcmB [Alphaproteobacteria bacterium]